MEVVKKIKIKRDELQPLKTMYSEPEKIPGTLRTKVSNKIDQAEKGLKRLDSDPGSVIYSKKVQRWAVVQVVKAFFGMPIVPGK